MVTGALKPTPLPLRHPAGRRLGAWWLGATLALALGLAAGAPAGARPTPGSKAARAPAAATPTSAASAPARNERFTFYGLTPAAAGQTVGQAEAALGQPLKPAPGGPIKPVATPAGAGVGAVTGAVATAPAKGCRFLTAERQPGVRYTVVGDQISRIETRDPRYSTLKGVHVGDALERARKVYGKRLSSTPHPYFDKGRMLTLYSPNRQHALVMESNDQGRIITVRGGHVPEVTWLEGCS